MLRTRHDIYLLAQSGLENNLETHMNRPSSHPYGLYGDPAYGLSGHFLCPLFSVTHEPIMLEMAGFNTKMVFECIDYTTPEENLYS